MSKIVSILLFTLLTLTAHAANEYAAEWEKGNTFFQAEQYDSAAHYYETIAEQKPHNAEIYYNLGNTYYRLNKIGQAVLNYERALKITPGHQQASDNLYLTQSRIENRIQKVPEIFFLRWWRGITQTSLTNVYAIIACLLFLIIIGLHIGIRGGFIKYKLPIQASVAGITLSLVFIVLSLISALRFTNHNEAIVMQNQSPLMAEPKYGAQKSLIPEGTKVIISDKNGSWSEVTLPDGRKGWLEQSSIERI